MANSLYKGLFALNHKEAGIACQDVFGYIPEHAKYGKKPTQAYNFRKHFLY